MLTARLQDLEGRSVPAGTLLVEIGEVDRLRADLHVTERLLDDLEPRDTVTAVFRGRLAPAHGIVASISHATFDSPATATARAEPLAPKEQPEQFTATTVFDNSDGTLRPGMVGYAKIYGRRASYAARTWRILKRWVQSIAW